MRTAVLRLAFGLGEVEDRSRVDLLVRTADPLPAGGPADVEASE